MSEKKTIDDATKVLNRYLFHDGARPKEVAASDDWDYVVFFDETIGGERRFYKHCGDTLEVVGDKLHLTVRRQDWIPNERAIFELKELMNLWRECGMVEMAETVENFCNEEGETAYVYDSLGEWKGRTEERQVPISLCKFYEDPLANPKGLGLAGFMYASPPMTVPYTQFEKSYEGTVPIADSWTCTNHNEPITYTDGTDKCYCGQTRALEFAPCPPCPDCGHSHRASECAVCECKNSAWRS